MNRTYLTTLVVFGIGIFGTSASQAATIQTLWARYGTPETGHVCDATPAVASLCNGQVACEVNVGNTTMCGDPDFLSVKKMVIRYGCGRVMHQAVIGEYTSVRLDCQ